MQQKPIDSSLVTGTTTWLRDTKTKNMLAQSCKIYINNNIVNHIMYADDMCLIAPCATAVQKLLDICYKYASTHDIVYNTKKSVCMLINSNKFNLRTSPTIKLGDTRLSYVSSYK